MFNKKHIIMTGIILASIAAGSGALIGLTNLLTKNIIANSEEKKVKEGLAYIYGEDMTYSGAIDIKKDDNSNYLDCYYTAVKNDELHGYIFKASGSNMYGKISLLVGISPYMSIDRISLIIDEQTYASTLEEEYIDKYNNGDVPFDEVDVKCGATYGATLVKNMVNQAKSWATNNLGGNK